MENNENASNDIEEILEAIERGEMQVYYQPQYDALTNLLISAEALVRWVRPDGTIIMPGHFIPELEKTDAIRTLDWYVLRQVCRMLQEQRLSKTRLVPISVNFSRRHVGEPEFLERLCATVEQYGVDRSQIIVEVTESAFVRQGDGMTALIQTVREAGFRIAVDDFGSGLSSLSFVKDMPVDILKIDRSLLSGNCEDEKERIVLETIVYLAHRLKLITVAEGVETREQLSFLRTCDCKLIQGFLFARPMPEREFQQLCNRNLVVEETEDILMTQTSSSAMHLLIEAIFIKYPLVIFSNLTRNSYYMMAYDNFSSRSCPSVGVFDELIAHGASTMQEEDQERFRTTFSIPNQMEAHQAGKKFVRLVTKQRGDDGIYRKVETTNYFVKSPSSEDVLVITLCSNIEDEAA
jgi:EAL domain-containing protein (putative c-di-GMP-specific phosphodiesterase class I)